MTKPVKAATIVVAGVFVVSGAIAAPCGAVLNTSVQVDVQEAPITMIWDIPLADLRAMSARFPRRPAHSVLGFYAGTVGYVLRSIKVQDVRSTNGPACPGLRLEADLVAVDRRIAIANDLTRSPCWLRAVVEHYRHHAAAASLALHRFASELPARLRPEIEQHILLQTGTSQELRQFVNTLLDSAVGRFTVSLAQIQDQVDIETEYAVSSPNATKCRPLVKLPK